VRKSRGLPPDDNRARLLLRELDCLYELGRSGAQAFMDPKYDERENLKCLLVSVQNAIEKMTPMENKAVGLVCFLGHPEQVAAEKMGISRCTLQTHLRSAYRQVGKILREARPDPDLGM
jgi:predicted DNA-binding protein (UPF0251 family)